MKRGKKEEKYVRKKVSKERQREKATKKKAEKYARKKVRKKGRNNREREGYLVRVMLQGQTLDPVEDMSEGFSRNIRLPDDVSKDTIFSILRSTNNNN
jgi:hypothetical protein